MLLTDLPNLPLTAEEFEHVADPDGTRLELWEGNLVVMAAAQMAWHSEIVDRVTYLLRRTRPKVLREVGVVLGPRDVPIPDVVVFHEPLRDLRRSQFPASTVSCVAEVISPESVDRDTKAKPANYAAAGIGEFWLVREVAEDPFDAQVEIFRLTPEGGYGLAQRALLSELELR